MKKDIESRDDLMKLMKLFYDRLLKDETISYLFTDVAKFDLEHHLPVIVDFWDSVIFSSDTYRKNAMQPHLVLHGKSPLSKAHFTTWLGYFNQSVDDLFEGDNAFLIKQRANSVATVMQIKINQLR